MHQHAFHFRLPVIAPRTRLASLALCGWIVSQAVAQHPEPVFRNTADYGARIQRTMNLIASSTAQNRNTVKLMVYGQSHSKQEWSLLLGQWLREAYPDVDFEFKNTSIGGCASECLIKSSLHEIREFYPDLLIFHVGIQSEWSYRQILEEAREHTACELILWTDYYPAGSDGSVALIRTVAEEMDAELVDAWVQFQEYLSDKGIDQSALNDGHMTEWGYWVMTELMKAHFVLRPEDEPDPDGLMKTYRVGYDTDFNDGSLTLQFAGNRIDAVTDRSALAGAVPAQVTIDGVAPSTISGCYVATRPNGHLGVDWMEPGVDWNNDWPWSCGGLYRVGWTSVPLVETWTATLTNINTGAKSFQFSVSGSVTGPDGSSSNAGSFTSNSGRVHIQDAQDWVLPTSNWWINIGDIGFTDGYTVIWDIEPRFVDAYDPPASADPEREHVVTLAQGLSNEDHTLVLTGAAPIKALRVYRPYWGRSETSVPDPVQVNIRSGPRYRADGAFPHIAAQSVYDLRGNRVQCIAGKPTSHGVYLTCIGTAAVPVLKVK